MTTPYNPTGQVEPVGTYVLPQDVVDLVVVETVNNPFVTSADNIAWLMVMFAATCSVKNFGAVGDITTNDTAAVQAALNARTMVFFPEGGYRVTGNLAVPKSSFLFGVRGNSGVILDHPTNHFFVFADNDSFVQFVDMGIEGMQSNTGGVFRATGARCNLRLARCIVNQDHYLTGVLVNGAIQTVTLEDTIADSRNTGGAYAISGSYVSVSGGQLEMAPAATTPMIGNAGSGSRVNLNGVYFSQVSTLGGLAFVDCTTGQTTSDGCTFDVDDSGAGSGTYAFKVNGGTMHTSNVTLKNNAVNYQFGLKAAAGSRLEMVPTVRLQTAAASFTLPNGVDTVAVDASNAAPPNTAILPRILFAGQRFTVIIQNGSAGAWTGPFVIAAQVGDGILDNGDGAFTDLPQDRACAVTFIAADYFGGDLWIQAGAAQQVPA